MTRRELLAELADVQEVISARRAGHFAPTMDARVALVATERLAELVAAMAAGLQPEKAAELEGVETR